MRFVSGINSLFFFRIAGKRILLLGEAHTVERWCEENDEDDIKIQDFISEIVQRIPRNNCLDVFLEGCYKIDCLDVDISDISGISFTAKMLANPENTLLRSLLFLKPAKRKNLRIHRADPRMIYGEESSSNFDFTVIRNRKRVLEGLIPNSTILKAVDYLLTINQRGNRSAFLKVVKAFRKTGNWEDPEDIEIWEKSYFKIIEKELSKIDTTIISREKLISNLRSVYRYLLENGSELPEYLLMIVPMDLYVLSRMFIRFDDKPNTICNKPTIDNIIIHSGSTHTNVYQLFLTMTFEISPEISEENENLDDLCLPVRDFDFWE